MEESEEFNPFELLGIAVDSPASVVKRAFKDKALRYHPDKNPSPDAAVLFQKFKRAQEVLLDEKLRAELEARLRGKLERQKRESQRDAATRSMRERLQRKEQEYRQKQQQQQQQRAKRKREDSDEDGEGVRYSAATIKVIWPEEQRIDEKQLRTHFQEFGNIESILVKKKMAYIAFESIRGARASIEAEEVIKSNRWRVDWASGRAPEDLPTTGTTHHPSSAGMTQKPSFEAEPGAKRKERTEFNTPFSLEKFVELARCFTRSSYEGEETRGPSLEAMEELVFQQLLGTSG